MMKTALVSSLLFTLSTVSAQTFPGFPITVDAPLEVVYANNLSIADGQQYPWQAVANSPNISSKVWSKTGKAVLIMMDYDVPITDTSRTTLLHWLAPDITGSVTGYIERFLTLPPTSDGVPYLQPSPPDQDYPHRYTFILFEQPRPFNIPASILAAATNETARFGFNLTDFMATTGMINPLSANYMLVANYSGPATRCYPPPLYSISSTTSTFTGTCTSGSTVAFATGTGSVTSTTSSSVSLTSSGSAAASAAPSIVSTAGAVRSQRGHGIALWNQIWI